MHPHIDELIMAAKRAGLVTSIVTNGSLLDAERLLKLRGETAEMALCACGAVCVVVR